MGKKFLRSFLIVISSFAVFVGLAACSGKNVGNTHTTSDSTTSHNSTTDTTSDSSTVAHSHNYNQQVVIDAYKVSNADCEHAATYYYSCSCGDRGSETFEYGSPLGHDYTKEDHDIKYLVNGADCEHSAVYHYACTRCGKVGEETYTFGNPLGHDYSA
ncbi:MAG: hypothetical protein PUG37_05945, partial [Bacillales bacterium]|nr:hypothetical protein [Bacillales bacterium]